MNKKDNIKTFIDEPYSKPHKKKYSASKISYNHIFEKNSINLMDMSGCKISKNKQFRYILFINDNVSKTHGVCR